MIPQANITEWRLTAPWGSSDQVEHDLVLSRAICELYSNRIVAKGLLFRGGTALHKLYFHQAGRFSEDLDFVQVHAGPIGELVTAIRDCLDHWLGNPSWKQNQGRFTFNYRFITEVEPIMNRKVKIEINTREHSEIQRPIKKQFKVDNQWYRGRSMVLTSSIEELMATKLRALYQRKKGRDLFDFWYAIRNVPNLNVHEIISIFYDYMRGEQNYISRAEFEKNLMLKQESPIFNSDIRPLLSQRQAGEYQAKEAYEILFRDFLSKLQGDSWKGLAG